MSNSNEFNAYSVSADMIKTEYDYLLHMHPLLIEFLRGFSCKSLDTFVKEGLKKVRKTGDITPLQLWQDMRNDVDENVDLRTLFTMSIDNADTALVKNWVRFIELEYYFASTEDALMAVCPSIKEFFSDHGLDLSSYIETQRSEFAWMTRLVVALNECTKPSELLNRELLNQMTAEKVLGKFFNRPDLIPAFVERFSQ